MYGANDLMGNEYKIKELIGKGPFSLVKRAQKRSTKEHFAVKIISKKKISANKLEVEYQLEQLEALDHPNIVRMQSVHDNEENYALVFELMSG